MERNPIMVMPRLPYSLQDVIDHFNFLDVFAAQMITRQVIMGLRDIHNLGYVHCDLKPANLMLSPKSKFNPNKNEEDKDTK